MKSRWKTQKLGDALVATNLSRAVVRCCLSQHSPLCLTRISPARPAVAWPLFCDPSRTIVSCLQLSSHNPEIFKAFESNSTLLARSPCTCCQATSPHPA
jgi:hypothetical protein